MSLPRWRRASIGALAVLLAVVVPTFVLVCKSKAHGLVTNPIATRRVPTKTPADYQLPFEDATVTSDDGLKLVGWWIPPAGRGVVMMVPGYKGHRGQLLGIARLLHQHGYGLLLLTTRAQDRSDGDLVSFGARELGDLDAWLRYARARAGGEPDLGMLGVSLGGQIAIRFTATHPAIRALVADCAFSSVEDTVATSVRHFTGLPAFPFAPMLVYWMEHEAGFRAADLDARPWIARVAPRPVLVMQGGADDVISPSSGRVLYAAAGDPKELWFEPSIGHAKFFDEMPKEYERRVVGFLDRSLPARNDACSASFQAAMLPLRMPRRLAALTLAIAAFSIAGCIDRLPDQDLRILQAVPVAKLPTDLLWREYQSDKKTADRKYRGQTLEVTGKITSIAKDPPSNILFVASEAAAGVQARLLDERAAATLADLAPGQRITLRCFCEGLETHVILKSCFKP